MILTPTQRRAMERAVATANEVLPGLDALKAVHEVDPALAPRHAELRQQRDQLHRVSSMLLQLDRDARSGNQ